ncbi:MAG: lamin tail domain-containing protein [Planctomycetes bacterium]|nr:lamin tail domain-containing protein [Planctomycetota bacterium]
MRTRLVVFTLVLAGVAGCNDGSKQGSRKQAAAAAAAVTTGGGGTTVPSSGTGAPGVDAPQVTGLAPGSGPLDGGTTVVISGSNFAKSNAGQTLVLFGNAAVAATPTSDTELQVTAPAHTQAGPVDVRVVNDLGVATRAGGFTYTPRAPSVAFVPAVGSSDLATQRGTRIRLSVKGLPPLTAAAQVDFGGTAATELTLVDAETIVAEVPFGLPPGATAITVREGGASATTQGFRVQGALTYGDLVINEVLFDPGSTDPNNDGVPSAGSNQSDEFIEIVNTTADPVDLTFVVLCDQVGTTTPNPSNPIHTFPNPTTLPPGGALVVFAGGTPLEFAARHASGHAQASTHGALNLSNSASTVETLSLEDRSVFPVVLVFRAELSTPGAGISLVNRNDGQRITSNPARAADYEQHPARPHGQGTVRHSAGTKKDGSPF